MQHTRINVPEHTVAQAVAVQQRAELHNVIRQMFGRHAGIFSKRDRLGGTFGVAEQPHRLFAHRVDTLNTGKIVAQLPANDATFPRSNKVVQTLAERTHLAFNQFGVITCKFHNVQTEHLFIWHIGNQLADGMPDDIFAGQVKHFRIDGFHRQRPCLHHKRRIAQCRIEGVIFNVHQAAHLRQPGDIQTRLGDKRQRAFRAGQHAG